MKTYIVQRGDTLSGISKQFGTSIEAIKKINNLTDNNLIVGETLIIPTYDTTNYVVKKGDSVYQIANEYGISVDELLKANNLTNDNLSIGQVLVIPLKNPISNNKDYFTYTVKKGDDLYSIASKYNTTVDNIKKVNNLTSDSLSIGQTLIIDPNISDNNYQSYTVQPGDTIYSIANKFNMPVNTLVNMNNLKSPLLAVGQNLKISENTYNMPGIIRECYGNNYSEPTYQTYTVKKNDNLYNIAKKYDTTVDNIIQLNNLKSTNLEIGQILKIKEIS